jgi:hypothetical protein
MAVAYIFSFSIFVWSSSCRSMNSTIEDANPALQSLSPMPGLSEKTSFLPGWKRDKQRLGSKRGVHVPFSILKTMKPFSKNFRKEELPVYWLSCRTL